MLSIPQYLLESSFCLLIFYGFYHLFLKNETFFQLNRAYLVLTPALSLSVPLLNISFQKDAPAESFEAFLYPAIQSANNINELVWEQMRAPSPVFSLSVADVLMAVYLVGAFLMAFTLLRGLWNLTRIIRRGKRSKNNEFTLVETQNNFPAASFFGYIFWNQQITDEQKLILEHEKVHIRQWHSLDVLLMEICVIIKWFNPLIYWFRNALRATHEYIADQYVIQQKSNVQDYATLLVNQQKSLLPNPLTNTFYSLTSKRLKMMLQRPSNKAYAFKYLMIVPLVSCLMLLFSFNLLEEIPRVSEGLIEMNSAISNLTETTVFEIDEDLDNNLVDALVETEEERFASFFQDNTNNKVHFGEKTFALHSFNPITGGFHHNVIEREELFDLLRKEISFTQAGKQIEVDEIEIFIPKLINGGEPLRIRTTREKQFKLSLSDIIQLEKRLHPNDNVYFNGYSEKDIYTTEFMIRGDQIVEKAHDYQLFWGDLEIPVGYHNKENTPHANYEMQLKEFIQMVRQPIQMRKSGEPFKPQKLHLTIHGKDVFVSWRINPEKIGTLDHIEEIVFGKRDEEFTIGRPIVYKKPEREPIKIELAGKENMVFTEEDYEKIFQLIDGEITVNIKTMDDFLIATSINVFTPSTKYRPPHSIRMPNMEVYNFQLITPLEGRAILKIDTIKSAKIARLYRDQNKYQIIHIPDFQTYERVLDEKAVNKDEVHNTRSVLYNSVTKADLLPNLIIEKPTDLELMWGDLRAAQESENLTLKEYYKNNPKTPKLLYQGKELAFEKIRMTIVGKESIYSKSFSATDFGKTEMTKILSKVENKTSIYFDKIEISVKGETMHLQQRFLFKIGNQVLKSSFQQSKAKASKDSNIQIKWGNYTFNCKEQMVDKRKTCDCEGKYLRKADLKKINKKGFEFLVNGNTQAFDQVYVYSNDFVFCKKEDLMLSSDLQKTYNPKACIWNAFDEGERGWVRFKTKEYDQVNFNFSIDSQKEAKTIEPAYLKIERERINLPPEFRASDSQKLKFTFQQIKEMVQQEVSVHSFGETAKVSAIKIMLAKNNFPVSFENLANPTVFEKYKNYYPSDKLFYLNRIPSNKKNQVELFFQLGPNDDLFKKSINEFNWGKQTFSFKDPLIKVTKKELLQLINDQKIKNYLGKPVSGISGIRFQYNDKENTVYGGHQHYDLKEMMSDPIFKAQFDQLENGDLLNIMNVHSDFIRGGLFVLIMDENSPNESFFKIAEGKGKIKFHYELPHATIYRNYKLPDLLANLMGLKPHEIKFRTPLDNPFINLTYLPSQGVDTKKDLLSKIKVQYPFTIKQKVVEQEGWFLSGGDPKKLEQFRQDNLPMNLTLFTEDNTKRGIETLGPVKFDWFATRYFQSKYQIEVINLTDFEGKFVLPLDSKNLKSLQQQLKRDFDLDLKKQRRSIEIKEIVFE